MAVAPQKLREATFQMLYSYDLGNTTDEAIIELLSGELALSKSVMKTIQHRVKQIRSHLKEIDGLIAATSHSYDFERIHTVERNILRLGAYELLYEKNTPQKVVFAECIRLAAKFSTKEAAPFINAILDAIIKKQEGNATNTKEIDNLAKEFEKNEIDLKNAINTMEIIPNHKDPKHLHE